MPLNSNQLDAWARLRPETAPTPSTVRVDPLRYKITEAEAYAQARRELFQTGNPYALPGQDLEPLPSQIVERANEIIQEHRAEFLVRVPEVAQ
jgi:hypothetical protein